MHTPSPCQIVVRAIRRINDDTLAEDHDKFSIDQGFVDVDMMIEQYGSFLNLIC